MNTDNFLIEERDLELARDICKIINDVNTRNRAVANAVAANIAVKFFDKELYNVDIETGLHNIGDVLEDIDISDIYIKNCYIDVRLFFDDESLNIPKEHFDNNRLPAAYMFIKVSTDLSGAEVVGFVLPGSIDASKSQGDYYSVGEDSLISFYDVESRLIEVEDPYNVDEKEIFAYLDNKLEDKAGFYKKLIVSKEGRIKLAKAAKAKYIFQFVSTPEPGAMPIQESPQADIEDSLDFNIELSPSDDNFLTEDTESDSSLDFSEDSDDSLDILDELDDDLDNDEGYNDDLIDTQELQEAESETIVPEINEELSAEDNISESIVEDNPVVEDNLGDTEETSSFDFTTTATPSIDNIEDTYEELLHEDEGIQAVSEPESHVEAAAEVQAAEAADNEQQIEALFNNEEGQDDSEDVIPVQQAKSGGAIKLLAVVTILAVIGGAGYFGYTKFLQQPSAEDDTQTNIISENNSGIAEESPDKSPVQEAMPIETVNSNAPKASENEGSSLSIPMIEQNLDASILVSNLKVDWEVPSGYASNASAKRYLVKLGKIIQLNLKTELLLLSKPPLTNKITVEIKYNSDSKKFETVGIINSSGEETVDQLIKQTVDKALAMNLSMNTNSFSKLQGNPVLVIRL